jgi:hypothetical protein
LYIQMILFYGPFVLFFFLFLGHFFSFSFHIFLTKRKAAEASFPPSKKSQYCLVAKCSASCAM